MTEDELHEPASPRGRRLAYALVILATFVTGFGAGVLSDGTVEVLNAFNANNRLIERRTVPQAASATQRDPMQSATIPVAAVADPVKPNPRGVIQWNMAVAPGTELTQITIRADRVEVPTRLRFYSLNRGASPALVASVWVDASGGAEISLPEGFYRVGSTRIRPDTAWDSRAGDEVYLSRPLRVEILDPDQNPPVLRIDSEGEMRSTSVVETRRPAPRARRRPSKEAEYEGLGASSTTGGEDTYGQ